MKYKVVKGCVIKGAGHQPGAVVELDSDLAGQLMGIGRIMPCDESEVENRSVGLEGSSEEPAKRRGRPKKVEEPVEHPVEEAPEE
jgi:hypothetical protein